MIILMSRLMRVGTQADVTAPTAPTITATETSSSAISTALTAAATDAVGVTGYELDWSPNGSSSWTNLPGVTVAGSFPYSHTGLSASTAYYYRCRARDAAGNWGSYGTSNATTESGSSGVFFEPDFDAAASVNAMFDDHNGNIAATFSTTVARPGGSTKSVKISYTADEDEWTGFVDFTGRIAGNQTKTLYCRKWIYYDSLWGEGHYPVGLKTSRYFTSTTPGPNEAYMSEKYIWQDYPPPTGDFGDPDREYVWGLNHACFNNDRVQRYTEAMIFSDSEPYVHDSRWYCYETFIEMNSADNVADGKLQCRINGVVVKNDTNVAFQASDRDDGEGNAPVNGTHWMSMWFGGNISVAANNNFPTGQTLDRYEQGYKLSTTADWESF